MDKGRMAASAQRVLHLAAVPPEKFGAMVLRTLTGILLALAGVGILYGVVRVHIATNTLSIPLLATGGGFLLLGGHVASGQIRKAVLDLVLPLKAVRKALGGKDDG